MFGFDKMFDFNRDGKLDSWEEKCWKMQDWIRMSLIFETE